MGWNRGVEGMWMDGQTDRVALRLAIGDEVEGPHDSEKSPQCQNCLCSNYCCLNSSH